MTITVSTGVEQVSVPNVVGQTETNATNTLRSRGFEVEMSIKALTPGDANIGRVVSQDPTSGKSADKGSTVTLVVGQATATSTTAATTTTSP